MSDASAIERRVAIEREAALLARIKELEAEVVSLKDGSKQPGQTVNPTLLRLQELPIDSPEYEEAWLAVQSHVYELVAQGKIDYPEVPHLSDVDDTDVDITLAIDSVKESHAHHSVVLATSQPLWSTLESLKNNQEWSLPLLETILSWYDISTQLDKTGTIVVPSALFKCSPTTMTAGHQLAAEDHLGQQLDRFFEVKGEAHKITAIIGYIVLDARPYIIIIYPNQHLVQVGGTVLNGKERKKVRSLVSITHHDYY